MSFSGKVVLVTGGSAGIGAATAKLFAKEGASVAIVGRNETKLQSVAANLQALGKAPLVIRADVSKDDDAKRIIKETIDKFGKLDVLVNNAGIVRYGTILDGKLLACYDEIMATNVRAVINLTVLAAPHLAKSKGNVVNVSSVAADRIADARFTPYCVSKAALDHFTRGAAKELAESGVRVNSVNPGPVRTDILETTGADPIPIEAMKQFTLLDRISEPEEIGELIMYLAGEKAKGITGSIVVSDNGYLLK